jgi:hypothetical protein
LVREGGEEEEEAILVEMSISYIWNHSDK